MPESFIEVDRRFDEQKYKNEVRDLLGRGFQEYLPPIGLTKTGFTPTARFVTVDISTPEIEVEKILKLVEGESGKKWEVVSLIETYDQMQKRLHVFLREKYSDVSLKELAEKIKRIPALGYDHEKDDYLSWVIDSLGGGNVEKARVDFEQQRGKFEKNEELYKLLCDGLYDDEVLSPTEKIKKWKEKMSQDD